MAEDNAFPTLGPARPYEEVYGKLPVPPSASTLATEATQRVSKAREVAGVAAPPDSADGERRSKIVAASGIGGPRQIPLSPNEPPMTKADRTLLEARYPSQRPDIRWNFRSEFVMPPPEARESFVRSGVIDRKDVDNEEAFRKVYESQYVRNLTAPTVQREAQIGAYQRGQWARAAMDPVIQRAEVSLPIRHLTEGGKGIDYTVYRKKLKEESLRQIELLDNVVYRTASPSQKKIMEERAHALAEQTFVRATQRYAGTFRWLTPYGEDLTDALMEVNPLLRPFASVLHSYTSTEDPFTAGSLKQERALNTFGRLVPSTELTAMLKTGESWGSRRNVEEIRSGIDAFSEVHLWGDTILQNFYDDPRSAPLWARKLAGAAIVVPMVLLEPDPASLALGIAAPIAKVVKVGRGMMRLGKTAQRGQESVDALTTGSQTIGDVMFKLRKEEPSLRLAFETAAASSLTEGRAAQGAIEHILELRKQADDLLAETAVREKELLAKNQSLKRGGDAKGVDETTLETFRAENAMQIARLRLEAATAEATFKEAVAKTAVSFLPETEKAALSYRAGQVASNTSLAAVRAELKTTTQAGAKSAERLKAAQQVHLDDIAELPEVKKLVPKESWARRGRGGDQPEVLAARVVPSGERGVSALQVEIRVPGQKNLRHEIKSQEFSPQTVELIKRSRVGFDEARRNYYTGFGKRINELRAQEAYLLEMKQQFKAGGPLRALTGEAKTAREAALQAAKEYEKTWKAAAAAGKTQRISVEALRKGLEQAGAARAKVAMDAVETDHVLKAMQGVVDSVQEHRKFVKENFSGHRAIRKGWNELATIGEIHAPRAQKVAGLAVRAGLLKAPGKLGEEGGALWDIAAAEAALKKHPGHGGVDYLELPAPLNRGSSSGQPVPVTLEQVLRIQEEIDHAALKIEKTWVKQADRAWGAAIQASWKDLEIAAKGDVAQRLLGGVYGRFARRFDYMGKAIGTSGEELRGGLRLLENTIDLGMNEFEQFARGGRASVGVWTKGELLTRIQSFMGDGLGKWNFKGGRSVLHSVLQGETLDVVGRRGILHATGTNPQEAADLVLKFDQEMLKKQEALDIKLRAEQDAAEKAGRPINTDFHAHEKQMLESERRALDHKLERLADLNPMFRTIAHAAIPTGGHPAPDQMSEIYKETLRLLGDASNTASDVADGVSRVTYAQLKRTSSKLDVHLRTAQAYILGTGVDRLAARMTQLQNGALSVEDAIALNRTVSGDTRWMARGDDVKAAQAAIEVGVPFTERSHQIKKAGAAYSKALVNISEQAIVPKVLMDHLEGKYSAYIKELTPFHRQAVEAQPVLHNKYMTVWKTSMITGYGIPNPRYWVNNMFGDFSQMWAEVGVLKAGRLSFQNFLPNFGKSGRAMQERMLRAGEDLSKNKAGRRSVLASVSEVMLNPYLGRVFKGEEGFFRTKYGRTITFSDLRAQALDDGILDTFVQEELLKKIGKGALDDNPIGRVVSRLDEHQTDLKEAANMVQQRQRMALYADLLQNGASRHEAKTRTLSALYDWKHGIADGEVRMMTAWMPFYRFWRLGMKQVTDAFLEPFTTPTGSYMQRALSGRTRLARSRQQAVIAQGLPDLFFSDNPDEAIGFAEQQNELYKWKFPGWMDTRSVLGASATSLAKRQMLEERFGIEATHTAYVLPPLTMLDTFSLANGIFALMKWGASKPGQLLPESVRPAQTLPTSVEATAFDPALSMTFPMAEWALRAIASQGGLALSFDNKSDYRNISATDEWIVRKLGGLGEGFVIPDKETGKAKVPSFVYAALRSFPLMGQAAYQAGPWVTNPHSMGDKDAYTYAFRHLTGLGKEYHYNAPRAFEYERKRVEEELARASSRTSTEEPLRLPEEARRKLPPKLK